MPAKLMTASSVRTGTAPLSQLLAVFQSPPAGLIQLTTAGAVRSSNLSKVGRQVGFPWWRCPPQVDSERDFSERSLNENNIVRRLHDGAGLRYHGRNNGPGAQ